MQKEKGRLISRRSSNQQYAFTAFFFLYTMNSLTDPNSSVSLSISFSV